MTSRRAKKVAIDQRRQEVAHRYVRGQSQTEIALELGVTQGTISTDLKAIRQQWRESAVRDFDLAREEQLRGIDAVQLEAWQAWDRSKKPHQEATVEGEGQKQKTRKRVRNQNGDPRYLEVVLRCIHGRRTLLGLDAPTKIAPTTPDGKPLSFEQRQANIMSIMIEKFGLAEVRALTEQGMFNDETEEYDAEEIGAEDVCGAGEDAG
jgi:hypothetical protein